MKVFLDKSLSKQALSDILENTAMILPQPNLLPRSYQQLKSLISEDTISVCKVQVCIKDCIIYSYNDDRMSCPECGESRYKTDNLGRRISKKYFGYCRLGDALQLMFGCKNIAQISNLLEEQTSLSLKILNTQLFGKDGQLTQMNLLK